MLTSVNFEMNWSSLIVKYSVFADIGLPSVPKSL